MTKLTPGAAEGSELRPSGMRRPLRVLVADDDRDEVLMLGVLLRDEGFEFQIVQQGDKVAPAVRDFKPDVVLLDIGMPNRSGYEIAQQLTATYGVSCPVLVAVTGWKSPSEKILAKLSGFDLHVAKPYRPQSLIDLLHSTAALLAEGKRPVQGI